jgi:hypothetical protein
MFCCLKMSSEAVKEFYFQVLLYLYVLDSDLILISRIINETE